MNNYPSTICTFCSHPIEGHRPDGSCEYEISDWGHLDCQCPGFRHEGPVTYDEAQAWVDAELTPEQQKDHFKAVQQIAEEHGFPLSTWAPLIKRKENMSGYPFRIVLPTDQDIVAGNETVPSAALHFYQSSWTHPETDEPLVSVIFPKLAGTRLGKKQVVALHEWLGDWLAEHGVTDA